MLSILRRSPTIYPLMILLNSLFLTHESLSAPVVSLVMIPPKFSELSRNKDYAATTVTRSEFRHQPDSTVLVSRSVLVHGGRQQELESLLDLRRLGVKEPGESLERESQQVCICHQNHQPDSR